MKLYEKLDIENFDEDFISELLINQLSIPKIYFSFKYSKGRKVIFYNLQLKVTGKSRDLLKGTAVKDSDGEQTFYVGQFQKGTEIEIKYGVIGFTKVPKAIALVAQTNPNLGFQVDPKTPGEVKTIERDEKWEGKIKYKIQ